ncbi:ATP-binding protein [Halalkalirubrum salinum]|uniref:ATP-binding protein n=1 Tax=Halalkalirubrum salinum TaxID=2563889 RepID=UPI0010FB8DFF|nr:ATP-binding protein [Halalkalirubrum salinum]
MAPGHPHTVLIVDDNRECAAFIKRMLEREDEALAVSVETEPSSVDSHVAAGEVDCVVSEYDLAATTGIELLTRVRECDPTLPYVLFTGDETAITAGRALRAGVTDYVRKDDSTDQFAVLANRIKIAVEHNRDTQRQRDGQQRTPVDDRERNRELERYTRLIEYSPDLLVVLNEDMSVRYQSPPSPLFEWEPRDIMGTDPLSNIHSDDRSKVIDHFAQIVSNPAAIDTTELRVRDANGAWRWVESRAQNFLGDEAIDGILVVLREITDRKQQERQLTRYSETLEALQTTTRSLLETTKTDAAARRAIAGLETVFAFDIAGIWLREADKPALKPIAISDRGRDLVADPPTYTEHEPSLSWAAYEAGEIDYVSDMSARKSAANPDTPIASELIVPLGEYGVLNIGSTDTEAFDEQEIRLVELWAETLTMVFARITQLEVLEDRESALQRERDRLDEFAGLISHDLRNPLNVAAGRAQLASEECNSEHLPTVTKALDRMETMLEDLLELARQGSVVGETEPVDLAALVDESAQTVSADGGRIDLIDSATVLADQSRLSEALENLFRNSVEHAGTDVTITVGVIADQQGIYVADDGIGIPEPDRETVFESGYSTSDSGTGFGLAIVKEICTAHGWEVHVTESEAGGARFDITGMEFINEQSQTPSADS